MLVWIQVVFVTMVYGPIAAFLVEYFPARIRYTIAVDPVPHRQRLVRRLPAAHRRGLFAATGNIYAGLIYPIVVALITAVDRLAVHAGDGTCASGTRSGARPTPMRARRPRSPEPDSSGHTGGRGIRSEAAAAALGSCSVFASGFPDVADGPVRADRSATIPRCRRSPHSLPMSRAPLRVGVLGAGTVGRAVIEGLTQHPERLSAPTVRRLSLAAVAVRDLEKARAAGVDPAMLTDAPAHLVADAGRSTSSSS